MDYSPSPVVIDDHSLQAMDLTRVFASALRHYRKARGLSQEALSEKADLDRTFVSQLERALKSPTLNSIERLAAHLGIHPRRLLTPPAEFTSPTIPKDYIMRPCGILEVRRLDGVGKVPANIVMQAINQAHESIDEIYSINLDIAKVLGMRNLSAFVGELVAAAILGCSNGLLRPNPHQDGYPDLLLMDEKGRREWSRLTGRLNEKSPFSPFAGGGIEVKATCGSVPSPRVCVERGVSRPDLGDSRIAMLQGYDWKAHHRQTNNLVGVLWDFIGGRPRVAALFYSSSLQAGDWGRIVQPRTGGGRTTSVSIMERSGIKKLYEGWLCVLTHGGYAEFLNRRNRAELIPTEPTRARKGDQSADRSA